MILNIGHFCGGFHLVLLVSFNNKTDRHDMAEMLLKVAFSTITLTLYSIRCAVQSSIQTTHRHHNPIENRKIPRFISSGPGMGRAQ